MCRIGAVALLTSATGSDPAIENIRRGVQQVVASKCFCCRIGALLQRQACQLRRSTRYMAPRWTRYAPPPLVPDDWSDPVLPAMHVLSLTIQLASVDGVPNVNVLHACMPTIL